MVLRLDLFFANGQGVPGIEILPPIKDRSLAGENLLRVGLDHRLDDLAIHSARALVGLKKREPKIYERNERCPRKLILMHEYYDRGISNSLFRRTFDDMGNR